MSTAGKVITCQAAVLWQANTPYSIETVEVQPPKKGEVRIKMSSTGLCHSDLHFAEGADPKMFYPLILGHEGAGIVESVGEGVESVAPGDIVVTVFESYCGECSFCKSPKTNLCQRQPRGAFQLDGTSRITCKGQVIGQFFSLGTFSEYIVTSEINTAKVNPKAPANQLCLVGCCIPTGYGAVVNAAQVPRGATCAIWGLGGVGMCVVMGCRDSGASKVIGIDINPDKFALAKELGCTHVLNPREVKKSVPEDLAEMTEGGVDYCFASVGVIPVMEEAFKSCHPAWGQTIIIGLTNMGESMRADIWQMLLGKKLRGTFYGGYKARRDIPGLVEKVLKGQIQLAKLITHKFPLTRINEGFDTLKAGKSLRGIIDYDLKA